MFLGVHFVLFGFDPITENKVCSLPFIPAISNTSNHFSAIVDLSEDYLLKTKFSFVYSLFLFDSINCCWLCRSDLSL